MASAAQTTANRSNAQKSTGPRTPAGKAKIAHNAVTHGLLARAAVLQGEDWEEYTCYHETMLDELVPDGLQETEVAERIVSLSWRLRRASRYQNAVFEALYDRHAAEPAEGPACPDSGASLASDPVLGRMLLADFSGDRVLERVLLYEQRIESSLSRARTDLRQLRKEGGITSSTSIPFAGLRAGLPASSMGVPPMNENQIHGQACPELAEWDARATHGRDAPATRPPGGVTTNAQTTRSCETKPINIPRPIREDGGTSVRNKANFGSVKLEESSFQQTKPMSESSGSSHFRPHT